MMNFYLSQNFLQYIDVFLYFVFFQLWRHALIMLEATWRSRKPCLGKSVRQRSYMIDLECLKCQSLSLRQHTSTGITRLRYRRRHQHNLKIHILVEIFALICITCFSSIFLFQFPIVSSWMEILFKDLI